jgi:hypothetical protein
MRLSCRAAAAALGLLILASAGPARSYSIDSPYSEGCHERITLAALADVRAGLETAGPLAPRNGDEQALLRDLPFSMPDEMHEMAAATLVLGNRNVDLKDNEPDDTEYLAQIHADPALQHEHCLRAPNHDEPDGASHALAACRSYIRDRALAALDGLDAAGRPDPSVRTTAPVQLEMRGVIRVELPLYWWEMGRALHALQDAFPHSYRQPDDQRRVVTVLNYVEFAEKKLDEAVDGPPHSSELDRCKDLDDLRRERLGLAARASADLMVATLDPTLDRNGKEAAVENVLSRYLALEQGCTFENGWCDAPERAYAEERGCVCGVVGSGGNGSRAIALLAGALALAWIRRRPRARLTRAAAIAPLLALALPATASAQEPEEAPPYFTAPEPDRPGLAPPPAREKDTKFPLGVQAATGASIANPAGVVALGLRLRADDRWLFGIDGELNPFYSRERREFRSGVTNVYATSILRFPMDFERVNLRTTLNLGVSRMNFDLYGVPEGSVGPFFGFNLLGIDYEMADQLYLVFNPAHIAVPIPQTRGVPYSYPQYRILLGIQLGA